MDEAFARRGWSEYTRVACALLRLKGWEEGWKKAGRGRGGHGEGSTGAHRVPARNKMVCTATLRGAGSTVDQMPLFDPLASILVHKPFQSSCGGNTIPSTVHIPRQTAPPTRATANNYSDSRIVRCALPAMTLRKMAVKTKRSYGKDSAKRRGILLYGLRAVFIGDERRQNLQTSTMAAKQTQRPGGSQHE